MKGGSMSELRCVLLPQVDGKTDYLSPLFCRSGLPLVKSMDRFG